MASLSLKGVQKIYPNGFHAVKDFNLEIADKEFIIFVGPSGCGKSTTLASLIDRINDNRNAHVITLEDPIEYLHTLHK